MAYDLMVIAAYPDDAEVQMGGTLAKLARASQRALIFDLRARKARLLQLGFGVDPLGTRALVGQPAYASAGNRKALGACSCGINSHLGNHTPLLSSGSGWSLQQLGPASRRPNSILPQRPISGPRFTKENCWH